MLLRVSIAKAGEDVTRCPEFSKHEITIGRRPTNDVILPDDGVSGLHAKILVTGKTLTLVDQGSTNGTFLGSERLEGPRAVGARDEVLISDYRLTFALVEPQLRASDGSVRTPVSPVGTEEMPLSHALGWSDDDALPPPPPLLLDDPEPEPAASRTRYDIPDTVAPPPGGRPREILPPRASAPPRPPAADAPASSVAFDFDRSLPESLHEQVFAAVWALVAADVVKGQPGIARRVAALVDEAIAAATRVGSLGAGAREQIVREISTASALDGLLKGEPDEILVLGTQGVRVDRGGHITVGPSPLSCATAVVALGSRMCGAVLDRKHPVARRLHGGYRVQAFHGSGAGGVPMLSLRRAPSAGIASLDELEAAGAVAPMQVQILRAAVRAGLHIVICVGPGASPRPVLAALMGAAASNELHVVVAAPGVDARGLRSGTVLLNRGGALRDVVESALRLGPSRLGLEDVPWTDTRALDALTSPGLRVIASIRARNPWVGLQRLATMLAGSHGSQTAARSIVASSVDLFVTVSTGRDGSPRILGLAEPIAAPSGEVDLAELAVFDPGSQTWSAPLGSSPCLDDLVHRGLLDPRTLQPIPTQESTG